MGSILIVVDAEVFDDDSGFAQVKEQFPIEALVAQPGMEALDPAVLPGTSRLNIDRFYTMLAEPVLHDASDELAAVVAAQMIRRAVAVSSPAGSFRAPRWP